MSFLCVQITIFTNVTAKYLCSHYCGGRKSNAPNQMQSACVESFSINKKVLHSTVLRLWSMITKLPKVTSSGS